MKLAEKFGRLLVRLWPLWLPLLLIFALPLTRPFGRIASDDFVDAIAQMVSGRSPGGAMPAAAKYPDDFDLLIWQRWNSRRQNYYSYNENNDDGYDELVKLRQRWPAQILLVAPPLQHQFGLPSSEGPGYDYGPQMNKQEIARHLRQLRNSAQLGCKLEPDNAFWWAALAHAQWQLNRQDLSLQALERAAKCPRYDDYTLELARRLVGATKRYGSPTFFQKFKLLQNARSADSTTMDDVANKWSAHASLLRLKGDGDRALRWAGALMRVGDLMQRDPNAWATMKAGANWQKSAYDIGINTKTGGDAMKKARAFAVYARAQKRADLAQLAPKLAARSQQVQAAIGKNSWRSNEAIWLQRGGLNNWVNLLEGLPFVLAADLIYLGLWWLGANLFLWRAGAAPSSRRERVGLGLATMIPLVAVGLGALWIAISLDGGVGFTPLLALTASIAGFGCFGPPFVLALACALVALRRHRAQFQLPPRIDTEMALANASRAFLRWFLPACVAFSIALLLLSWAMWLVATARGWGNVDLLALLPPDRRGFTGNLSWDSTGPTLPAYAVSLCVLCLLVWFGRWRWTMPIAVRPLTQSALRWWKESLGVSLVVLSWICLLLALVSVPMLREADARLGRVLQIGELRVAKNGGE